MGCRELQVNDYNQPVPEFYSDTHLNFTSGGGGRDNPPPLDFLIIFQPPGWNIP